VTPDKFRPGYGAPANTPALQILGPHSGPKGNQRDKCEVVLMTVGAAGEESGGICFGWVTVPSAKVRARISVFAVPTEAAAGNDNPMVDDSDGVINGQWGLWAVLVTRSGGGIGATGAYFPTENIVGTKASPLQIPTDPGLWGHEFEIETAAASVLMLRVDGVSTEGAANYQIRAQVTYQAIEPMSPEEWREFVDNAGIRADPPIVFGQL
jgi:hypothetical protein